jgi:hypothetical protein
MHLSYILSLPTSQQTQAVLPDLPKEWGQLTRIAGIYTQVEQQTIKVFTKSPHASAAKLRIVLHSALMISPIYLLLPYALRKCKSFTRETMFEVSSKPITANHFADIVRLSNVSSQQLSETRSPSC